MYNNRTAGKDGDTMAQEHPNNSTKTISAVMAITLLGKLLGLYRDRLLAVHYGTGMAANAFYTASRIPRVFFDAVFASAIAACFIPAFSECLQKRGRQEAFRFASSFLTVITFFSALLTVLGMLFAGPMVTLFADGYDAPTAALAAELTRMMFPTVLFTGAAFSFVGILQSLDEFNVPAFISTVSNLVILLYFWTLDGQFGIWGLAWAFLAGWFLQAAVQIPALRRKGFRYTPCLDLRSYEMGRVFALMGPVMVSTWVQPINLTINSKFGSRLYGGAGVSAIEYATNLYLILAGVFVLSITNVIFPQLSRLSAGEEKGAFAAALRQTLRGTLFFVLPMSAGLMILARPLVSFLYGDGRFDAFSIEITSQGLFWVSLGMAGYAAQNILSRAYFARQQGKVPLLAGGASILVNILLCAALAEPFGVAGLAVSSAVSSTVYALLLLAPMQRREKLLTSGLWAALGKMLAATLAMSAAALGTARLTDGLLGGKPGLLLTLGATALAGAAVYFGAALLLGLEELSVVKKLLKRG